MAETAPTTDSTGQDPVQAIARDALRAGVGERLPTTVHYQEALAVGSGTVQKALRQLRDGGALSLVARGHQGTFITAMDPALLWAAARLAPVHLLLPPNAPPESLRVALGVAGVFTKVGALTTVGYLRGAEPRLRALGEGGADITLMSAGAAADLLGNAPSGSGGTAAPQPLGETGPGAGGPPAHRALTLNSGSYYAPGSLAVVSRAADAARLTGRERLRIGIDPRSDDHQRLTYAQFPSGGAAQVEYVETDFTHVPRAVSLGGIDAGVWHTVDTLVPLSAAGLAVTPLTRPEATALADAISPAVLVATDASIPGVLLERAAARGALATLPARDGLTALAPVPDPLRLRLDQTAG